MIEEGIIRKYMIGERKKEELTKRGQKRELQEKYDKKKMKSK